MSIEELRQLNYLGETVSSRLYLRPSTLADFDLMSSWPFFTNPVEQLFNIQIPPPSTRDSLFWERVNAPGRRSFMIVRREDDVTIGRLTLREIDLSKGSARLGIFFPVIYVNQGYGTEILVAFLHFFLVRAQMTALFLDVLAVNTRALNCYFRVGFVTRGSSWNVRFSALSVGFLRQPEYMHLLSFFRWTPHGVVEALSYDMSASTCYCSLCSDFPIERNKL